MRNTDQHLTALGRAARAFSLLLLVYWGLVALVSPVINIDSQIYNLARLDLALRGGLFNNDHFTSIFHVMYPWGFDAVHLPFLAIGWGYALPSFACLAGLCHVVLTMMRSRYGPDAAWASVLGLLALPCLVYQASSTKNDLAVLFAGAVWVYARWRREREQSNRHLLWMVLALGFMAGAKTTGLLYAVLLSLWTLWEIRQDRKLVLRAAGGLAVAGVLFGSVETYIESARLFGHPMGPPALLERASNRDGAPGAVANLLRHLAGGIYVGPTSFADRQPAITALNQATVSLLDRLGLVDRGIDPRFPDRLLFLAQSGLEELSGFGPLGTLAIVVMLGAALIWRPQAPWWRLATFGLLGMALVSLTLAYNSWMNRYLIAWYTLGTLAVVCLIWQWRGPWLAPGRWGLLLLAAGSAVAAPLLSFNRHPACLAAALLERERLETSAYPIAGEDRAALRRLRKLHPTSRIFVLAHNESVLLPLLQDQALAVVAVNEPSFRRLLTRGTVAHGDLVLQESLNRSPLLTLVEETTAPNVYSLHGTHTHYIYRYLGPPAAPPPAPPCDDKAILAR